MEIKKDIAFSSLLEILDEMPLWIMQGLYIEVKNQLKDKGNTVELDRFSRTEMIQLFTPELSKLGKDMFSTCTRDVIMCQTTPDVLSFLDCVRENKNIIDIAITNKWTLEDCARIMYEAMENHYIETNWSAAVHTTVLFLAGRIKIGEFLIRKNMISQPQLERALQLQSNMDSAFEEHSKIVEILINLGYIKPEEVADHILLKQVAADNVELSDITQPYIERIELLEKENAGLYKKYNESLEEKLELERLLEEVQQHVIADPEQRQNIERSKNEAIAKKNDWFDKL